MAIPAAPATSRPEPTPTLIELPDLDLVWTQRQQLSYPRRGQPDFYWHGLEIGIHQPSDEEDESGPKVGFLSLTRVLVEMADEDGVPLRRLLDFAEFDEELIEAMVDKDGLLREDQRSASVPDELLLVRKVRLDPQWRGRGTSLVALSRILDLMLGARSLAVLMPMPLRRDVPNTQREADRACTRLAAHWGRLGFEQTAPGSGVWTLSGALIRPPIGEVLA